MPAHFIKAGKTESASEAGITAFCNPNTKVIRLLLFPYSVAQKQVTQHEGTTRGRESRTRGAAGAGSAGVPLRQDVLSHPLFCLYVTHNNPLY